MLSGPIPDRDSESDEVIDSLLQRLQDEMKLPLKQLAAIQNAKGVRKVLALASALRTYEFMARYADAHARAPNAPIPAHTHSSVGSSSRQGRGTNVSARTPFFTMTACAPPAPPAHNRICHGKVGAYRHACMPSHRRALLAPSLCHAVCT